MIYVSINELLYHSLIVSISRTHIHFLEKVFGDVDSPIIPVALFHPGKMAAFSRECLKRNVCTSPLSIRKRECAYICSSFSSSSSFSIQFELLLLFFSFSERSIFETNGIFLSSTRLDRSCGCWISCSPFTTVSSPLLYLCRTRT
jgi:hypothetical protein